MKQIKKVIKTIYGHYLKGFNQLYGPCIKAGINPFI